MTRHKVEQGNRLIKLIDSTASHLSKIEDALGEDGTDFKIFIKDRHGVHIDTELSYEIADFIIDNLTSKLEKYKKELSEL